MKLDSISGPHSGQPVLAAGADVSTAGAAMILVHGRGAGAASILALGEELVRVAGRDDIALLAPDAASAAWYPQRFIAPESQNEPWLSSARQALDAVVEQLGAGGLDQSRVMVVGFSQGACLVSDLLARSPARYGGALIYSGGLIGPMGTSFAYSGSLDATPVFVGCSDIDMHIPVDRVYETADTLKGLGAAVDLRIYPGMSHTVNEEELEAGAALVRDLPASAG